MKLSALCALAMPIMLFDGSDIFAEAKDYPYSGYFTFVNTEYPGSLDAAMCVYNFFLQRPDGSATSYHLDLAYYETAGKVRYVEYNQSQCIYHEYQRIESCTSIFDVDKTVIGKSIISVLNSIRPNYLYSTYYEKQDDALAGQGGSQSVFFRCRFDPRSISASITSDRSQLDADARMKIVWPERERLMAPATTEIMQSLGLAATQ